MLEQIVPQIEEEVKKCADERCGEDVFRDGLCFKHFAAEQDAAWDDHCDEVTYAHLVNVGRG